MAGIRAHRMRGVFTDVFVTGVLEVTWERITDSISIAAGMYHPFRRDSNLDSWVPKGQVLFPKREYELTR